MSTVAESSKSPVQPSLTSVLAPATIPLAIFQPSPFLDRLCKWLSTLVGTDQLIMLIQNFLDILRHHMNVDTAESLLYVLNQYIPFPGTQIYPPSPSPSTLSIRLKTLSDKFADVRILLRLHGIIPTYQLLLATHASPPSDPTLATVAKLQTYANMLYFPLENAAYLASHSIIPMTKRHETNLWLWSSRFWAVYVVLELIRLYRERQIARKGKEAEKASAGMWDKKWWGELVMNLAYAPQTIHWSVEGGVFRDIEIAYLGFTAAVASIYLNWRNL